MQNLNEAKKWLENADAVIVTAGNGFAAQEGLDILSDQDFDQNFPEVAKKYNVHTIADAFDKKFDSWTEAWLFWSKLIDKYTLNYVPSNSMQNLKQLIGDKDYFIATSAFGHFFEKAGFNEKRIFNIFGDWTNMQCSSGINHGIKSDLKVVQSFIEADQEDRVNESLVPKCEDCNSEMEIHVPLNAHFYPDTDANTRFRWFLTANEDKNVVTLELGVDETSPQLLAPMINLTQQFSNWKYIAADLSEDIFPDGIDKQVFAYGETAEELLTKLF